jgi:hypothetical protein
MNKYVVRVTVDISGLVNGKSKKEVEEAVANMLYGSDRGDFILDKDYEFVVTPVPKEFMDLPVADICKYSPCEDWYSTAHNGELVNIGDLNKSAALNIHKQQVTLELMQKGEFIDPMEGAYCDVNPIDIGEAIYKYRNLDWRSDEWFSVTDTISLFKDYCPEYNEFQCGNLGVLSELGEDVMIQPAREGSVCIYIKGAHVVEATVRALQMQLMADEVNMQPDNTVRVWWD